MATTETPRTIVRQFVNGEKITKRLDSLVVRSYQIESYGPHYPLVIKRVDGSVLLNTTPSTPTTNRHKRGAAEGLTDAGYVDTGERVENGVGSSYYGGRRTHIFAVYKKV